MGGTLLQWFMWTHVALSATFTAVCVARSTWKGPSHLLDFQLFLLWSRITTKSPGLTSCRNLSATFSFYLHRNIWQQTRHFLAVIQHVILTHIRWWQPLFTPFHAHEWWPAGAGWDAKGVFIPLATLCVFTSDASFAKNFSNHCNPFVNHNSFLPFDTWSNPCVNLA